MTGHPKLEALVERCATLPPLPTAVVHPCDVPSLDGALRAHALVLRRAQQRTE